MDSIYITGDIVDYDRAVLDNTAAIILYVQNGEVYRWNYKGDEYTGDRPIPVYYQNLLRAVVEKNRY